jgi:hypothetical protein
LQQCRAYNHQPRCTRNKIGVTGELAVHANYSGNVEDSRRSVDSSAVLTPAPHKPLTLWTAYAQTSGHAAQHTLRKQKKDE